MATGDQDSTWGDTTNTNLGTLLEQAISGYVTQAITNGADTVITIPNGVSGVARNMYIELTGTLTAARNLVVPANKKLYFIYNNTVGGFPVTVKVAGQTGVVVPNGYKYLLVSNGTDVVQAITNTGGSGGGGGTYFNQVAVATQGQTVFSLTTPYLIGSNNLSVYVNGSKQIAVTNYTETSTTSITFLTGLNVGDLVQFTIGATTALSTNASAVLYNEGGTGAVDRNVEQKLQESVSVKDFGAVGDGVADDTTAIQAALNAAFTAGGGGVYVPTGTYKITLPLIVRSNTSLYGDGASSVIYNTTFVLPPEGDVIHVGYGYEWNENGQKFNPASNNDATMAELLVNDFSNITTQNVSVSNLCVKADGPGLGVWTLNASDVVIENIWSIDTLTPINIANDAGGWQAACYNVSVSNIFQISIVVGNSWYDLVFVGSAIKVSISKCFNNPDTPSGLDGMIVISGGKYINVSDCHLIGAIPAAGGKRGVIVQNSGVTDASSNSVTNNNIKSMLDGVFVNASAENIISNNSIEDCLTGITINAKSCIVDSNFFSGNTYDLSGTNNLTQCQITNNRDLNNFIVAANAFDMQEYNNVSGNTNNTLPYVNHDTYPILKCRYLNFFPQDAFLSQADLAKTATLGAIVTLNAAGSITLFYKIPPQVKKISKLDVFGYSGTQFDKVTASIVGVDGPINTNAFATIQSLGFFIPTTNADYTLSFGLPTQAIDPFFNQGTYYIKILWEPTIYGGPPDLSSQLRGIEMISFCDD